MDEGLEASYNQLVAQAYEFDDIFRSVADAIEEFEKKTSMVVRADAKYFIGANMAGLIFRPVVNARARDEQSTARQYSDEELLHMIRHDTRTILKVASGVAGSRKSKSISATSVVYALAEVIERLEISNVKLWGRSDD